MPLVTASEIFVGDQYLRPLRQEEGVYNASDFGGNSVERAGQQRGVKTGHLVEYGAYGQQFRDLRR